MSNGRGGFGQPYNVQPLPQGWYPPPPPRLVNRGIQGGEYDLNTPQWQAVLRLESKCPDAPSSELNDHYRTIYAQITGGRLSKTVGEDSSLDLGVLLRFKLGIGNGSMTTIYDVVPNGILHVAVTGESVEVEAATAQIFFDGPYATEITPKVLDEPTIVIADAPPKLTIGVIQNQALAMNRFATPKRIVNVTVPSVLTRRAVPVPKGAQSVTVLGPACMGCLQVFGQGSDPVEGVTFPTNREVPLVSGAWEILLDASALGSEQIASVVFGLGI